MVTKVATYNVQFNIGELRATHTAPDSLQATLHCTLSWSSNGCTTEQHSHGCHYGAYLARALNLGKVRRFCDFLSAHHYYLHVVELPLLQYAGLIAWNTERISWQQLPTDDKDF